MNEHVVGKGEPRAVLSGKPMVSIDDKGPEDHNSDIFFAAVETTRMPMVITDPHQNDNPIIFVNEAFIEMTGYQKHEILGRNCRFLQGPKTDAGAVAQVRKGIEELTDVSVEMINYKKDGSSFWNALFVSPVKDKQGNLKYYFASQLDVTRRRLAEDALSQSKKMEALGQLTGGLAHDFNNLLQVIIGHLDRTRMKLTKTNDVKVVRGIDFALGAAEKGANLTSQLLSFARKQRLDTHAVNMNELITSVGEMAQRTMGRDISYKVDLEHDLRVAKADPTQTEMAVLNILINARDAMPDGGTVTIRTRNWTPDYVAERTAGGEALAPGHYICVSITDTGTGIPPEVLERVTEPFFTTKEQGKGTGLGLSSAYGYMRQSGGTLMVESEVGRGTTVSLLFPASTDVIHRDSAGHTEIDNEGAEVILVVEDQDEVMALTELVLSEAGYKLYTARNGAEALKLSLEIGHIDLLFSDIIMPGGINGITLANELAKSRPGLRVLLTTGYSQEMSGRSSGLRWPVLQKPYRPSNLTTAIREVLDAPDPSAVRTLSKPSSGA